MRLIFCILACLSVIGCSVDETWVRADRAVYNVVAPAHREYIAADSTLTDGQRLNRTTLLDAWNARITEWEKEVE